MHARTNSAMVFELAARSLGSPERPTLLMPYLHDLNISILHLSCEKLVVPFAPHHFARQVSNSKQEVLRCHR